jgi:hypothetical protein
MSNIGRADDGRYMLAPAISTSAAATLTDIAGASITNADITGVPRGTGSRRVTFF